MSVSICVSTCLCMLAFVTSCMCRSMCSLAPISADASLKVQPRTEELPERLFSADFHGVRGCRSYYRLVRVSARMIGWRRSSGLSEATHSDGHACSPVSCLVVSFYAGILLHSLFVLAPSPLLLATSPPHSLPHCAPPLQLGRCPVLARVRMCA